jgi:hypothetical protein
MSDRGRLTPVDVVFFMVGMGILGALGPVYLDLMSQNIFRASRPVAWFARLLVPLVGLTLLAFIYANAAQRA